jgi:hypothetical protein
MHKTLTALASGLNSNEAQRTRGYVVVIKWKLIAVAVKTSISF